MADKRRTRKQRKLLEKKLKKEHTTEERTSRTTEKRGRKADRGEEREKATNTKKHETGSKAINTKTLDNDVIEKSQTRKNKTM